MIILIDENMDEEFPEFIPDHDARHVISVGWQGTKNGVLLAKAAEAGVQVFVTADKNMPYQQSMKGRPFFLIVLDIHPNVLVNQVACIPEIRVLMERGENGSVYFVEGPHPKRRNRT